MAKVISSDLLAHLRGSGTTLALCWKITKRNGAAILGTDHDLDITINTGDFAGTYLAGANISGSDVSSSADMSVDNLEVQGAVSDEIAIPDLTIADIEAGLLNNAPVSLFFVNWNSPDDGQVYLRSGWLGQLTWDTNNKYSTELRGLTQLLSQQIVQNYSQRCNVVRFGDSRCKFDVDAVSITATVSATGNRKVFVVTGITDEDIGTYSQGLLVGLTGDNQGFTRQIRLDTTDTIQGKLTMFEAFPADLQIGDTFTMKPGCDRSYDTCKNRWNNLVNHRAYGLYVPGIDAMMKGPAGASTPAPSGGGGGGTFVPGV